MNDPENTDSNEDESIVTIINPEEDDIDIELEFYDETMEGVDGVTMPSRPEEY